MELGALQWHKTHLSIIYLQSKLYSFLSATSRDAMREMKEQRLVIQASWVATANLPQKNSVSPMAQVVNAFSSSPNLAD